LTNVYPNNKKKNNNNNKKKNNKVKSKPLELRSRVKNSSHEISVSDSAGSYCRIIWRLIAPGQFLCSFYDVHVNNSQLMI
jgi:hypothetical protein